MKYLIILILIVGYSCKSVVKDDLKKCTEKSLTEQHSNFIKEIEQHLSNSGLIDNTNKSICSIIDKLYDNNQYKYSFKRAMENYPNRSLNLNQTYVIESCCRDLTIKTPFCNGIVNMSANGITQNNLKIFCSKEQEKEANINLTLLKSTFYMYLLYGLTVE